MFSRKNIVPGVRSPQFSLTLQNVIIKEEENLMKVTKDTIIMDV